MILLVLLLLTLCLGRCPVERDKLLECFERLVDYNHDNAITASEIDSFLLNTPMNQRLTGTMILKMCDINKDGVLTIADWTPPEACLRSPEKINLMCKLCESRNVLFV